eukprot:TRINITY_DN16510_c0_g1_i1.p1 TRINITY_DN16510_c0_g1~~TRINITY_DN16510_c0_g1_i1.p1  ORF type:complete len:477 (+),score=104.09 TRINITY_DN16510_c0_g1_i1:957-2387(+)
MDLSKTDADDQYRILRLLADQIRQTISMSFDSWKCYKNTVLDMAATVTVQTDALSRAQQSIDEAQSQLVELERQRDALDDQLQAKSKQINSTKSIMEETETRILSLLREGEGKISNLRVQCDGLQTELVSLRREAVDRETELAMTKEAKERMELSLQKEVSQHEQLTKQLSQNMAAKDDKESVILSLENETRQMRVNEERLTTELNKLHSIRADKERLINTLTEQNTDSEKQLATLQTQHSAIQAECADLTRQVKQLQLDGTQSQMTLSNVTSKKEVLEEEIKNCQQTISNLQSDLKRSVANEKRSSKEANYFRSILLSKDSAPPLKSNMDVDVVRPTVPAHESLSSQLQNLHQQSPNISNTSGLLDGMGPILPQGYSPTPVHDDSGLGVPARTISPPRPHNTQRWSPVPVPAPSSQPRTQNRSPPSYHNRLHDVAEKLRHMIQSEDNEIPQFLLNSVPESANWGVQQQQWPVAHP